MAGPPGLEGGPGREASRSSHHDRSLSGPGHPPMSTASRGSPTGPKVTSCPSWRGPSPLGGGSPDADGERTTTRRSPMKALVYHGPGSKAWEDVPDPTILARHRRDRPRRRRHHLRHRPAHPQGRRARRDRRPHPRPRGRRHRRSRRRRRQERRSSATGCSCRASPRAATCRFCREGRYGQCLGGGGWILGHTIDGTQAEYVRVPFADTLDLPRARRASPTSRS